MEHQATGTRCKDCGFDNPPTEEFCQACNTPLQLGQLSLPSVEDGIGSRYRQIRGKVEELQRGKLGAAEFAKWLEDLSIVLAQRARAIVQNIEAGQYWKENPDEVEIGLSGVRSFEQGLEELWRYAQDYDPAHLELGLQMVWEGNQRIVEAMHINRDSRQTLALLWEQLQGG